MESRITTGAVVGTLLALSACAPLTSSQVKEVGRFAQASSEYTELPGSVVHAYAVLLRDSKLLSLADTELVSVDRKGKVDTVETSNAWDTIQQAYASEQELDKSGKQMDSALGVLDAYSKLLAAIASDDYTGALDKSAEALGKSIDNATDSYNQNYRAAGDELNKAGGSVGQIVRTFGGFYIRSRQARILKETIAVANPIIQGLMKDVQGIASNILKPALSNYEKNYLEQEFRLDAARARHLSVESISTVYGELARVRGAVSLADQVAEAAHTYASAHAKLTEMTKERRDLDSMLEEIDALKKEVQAGQKTKKAIEG